MSVRRTKKKAARRPPPLEYSLLLTATLCLLAFGAVMVFSASSARSLLTGGGNGFYYLERTLVFGAIGLAVMRVASLRGVAVARTLTPVMLIVSLFLLVAVLVPGVGQTVNGAQRWMGAGLLQFQPSELAKLSLILYGAYLLSKEPRRARSLAGLGPYLLVVAGSILLVAMEPDLGTAMIAAVIGEELGLVGVFVLVGLFGMFGYAGLRAAHRARDRFSKLLAAGLTSLILAQAALNLFAVFGLAPLTGVPLPFVSYGGTSLVITLASAGLILNVARRPAAQGAGRRRSGGAGRAGRPTRSPAGGPARLGVIDGGSHTRRKRVASGSSRDSGRRHGGARRAGD